ncbi:hypothetical protein [Neisseria canis]|uniref:hypothetical protein n=1 Tax=Neisseria canis TaxID=493 RepID=UPI001E35A55F|nr:hypothetical protein [Neisseria canis]
MGSYTERRGGFKPVKEWGKDVSYIFLKKGEIWKIGETKNIVGGKQRRYSEAWLRKRNLEYRTVMRGPKSCMRDWEYKKILKYIKRWGRLPAGNKCKH